MNFWEMKSPNHGPKSLPGWPLKDREGPEIDHLQAWDLLRKHIKYRIQTSGFATMESLAQEAGINKGLLSKVLNGKRDPQFSTIWKILNALGMNEFPRLNERPAITVDEWDRL